MENIKDLALEVQSKGTGGDTILAHINPYEADILKMVGGVGTPNPETGLPEYKSFWKRWIAPIVTIAIIVFAPEIALTVGESLGFSGAAATTAGNAVISAGTTAASGGSPEEIAKAAVLNAAGSTVGGAVSEAAGGGVAGGAAGGAAKGATQALLTGQDPLKSAAVGGVSGGVGTAVRQGLTPDIPLPSGSTADTGQGFDYVGGMTPEQVAAANPDLYPGGTLPQAGTETVFAPSGQTYAQESTPITARPTEFAKAAGKVAGRYAGQTLGSSLYDQPSTSTDRTLTSTGLFTPQSILPTAISGIAPSPVATGRSIIEGSEDEATGAWGAKTLRG